MKIAILTLGTRGDVQPYIALGLGLEQAGYAVTLGTSQDFEGMASEWGLSFAPFEFSVRSILDDPDCRAAFQSKRAALRLYRKVAPMMPRLLDDAWAAAQGAEAVLYHPKILNGYDIAERLGIPAMLAFYLPALSPTRAFPAPFIPGPASWGGLLNKFSHGLFLGLMTAPYHGLINRWRRRMFGLPGNPRWGQGRRRYGKSVVKLYGYSPHLVPPPSDWDSSSEVTGQWFLDSKAEWQPPPELVTFLEAGPPPVFVGFGSIAGPSPERSAELVLDALKLSGQRAVLVTGWGGLRPCRVPDTVFCVESAPYDWLLPRVVAVVHHGGAGSTAEGIRAGKPTVVCPFFGDQPFWGSRVEALGVGPRPLPQKGLIAQDLAAAIRVATTDEAMGRRALLLGEKVRAERGVQRAVQVITDRLNRSAPGRRSGEGGGVRQRGAAG